MSPSIVFWRKFDRSKILKIRDEIYQDETTSSKYGTNLEKNSTTDYAEFYSKFASNTPFA